MTRLYKKLQRKNIRFSHVCEVGVYHPEYSNIIDFIREGIKTTLVEADPESVKKIRNFFSGDNVHIFPVAVWDYDGVISFSKAKASTFVSSLTQSPALVNDKYEIKESETFEAECRQFSSIDDGTIELLSADIEGAEWYVLKTMQSRPKIISIETHGKYYTNPFISQIKQWMDEQQYLLWYKDRSDSVYVRKDIFRPALNDKLATFFSECALRWKRFKKVFK